MNSVVSKKTMNKWHFIAIHCLALLYKTLHKANEMWREKLKWCPCSEESQFKKRLNVELKNVMMRMDLEEATCKAVSDF